VRVVEAPGELDGHVERGRGGGEALLADGLEQAAPVHVLREHAGDAVHAAHVVAGHDVRVQAQPHPRLRLALEGLGAAGRLQRGAQRRLHGQVHAPAAVAHAVDAAHAALAQHGRHLVEAEHGLPHPPLGIGAARPRGGGDRLGRGLADGGRGVVARPRLGHRPLRRAEEVLALRAAHVAAGDVGRRRRAHPAGGAGEAHTSRGRRGRAHGSARSASRKAAAVAKRRSRSSSTARSTTAPSASGSAASRVRRGTVPPERITCSGSLPGAKSRG
jgi:hypothetical protein